MLSHLPTEDLSDISSYYEKNHLDLESASFLITGATGFVGSWLTEALLHLDKEFGLDISITCISRDTKKAAGLFEPYKASTIEIVEADLRCYQGIQKPFSHIVHAATPTTQKTRQNDIGNVYGSSVIGATNLLNSLAPTGTPPVFLHTSSGAVYGPQPWELPRRSLSTPIRQVGGTESIRDSYDLAKIETEKLVTAATQEGKILGINARLFAFMGPRLPLDQHYAIGNFISGAIDHGVVKINGDGKSIRSYLYASEMTMQLLFLLSEKIIGPSHIGSEDGQELREWAEKICDVCGSKVEILNQGSDVLSRYVPERDLRIPQSEQSEENYRKQILRWKDWIVGDSRI